MKKILAVLTLLILTLSKLFADIPYQIIKTDLKGIKKIRYKEGGHTIIITDNNRLKILNIADKKILKSSNVTNSTFAYNEKSNLLLYVYRIRSRQYKDYLKLQKLHNNSNILNMLLSRDINDWTSLAISNNGNLLAFSMGNIIYVWDINSNKKLYKLIGHYGNIERLEFSKDNNYFLSADRKGIVKLWNLHNGDWIHDFKIFTRASSIIKSVDSLCLVLIARHLHLRVREI